MIYFPVTCNILTPGHIKCFEFLAQEDELVVGLLTSKALKGYKKELVPFADRKFILESLDTPMKVVPQDSLDPLDNLKKYGCDAMASGDGFEDIEREAMKKLKIKLPGERGKKYSTSKLCQTIKKSF
jgi:glycerol-3-phosphate cytidylyltransferase-like family protein